MNRNMIMLISMMFCGSFALGALESSVVLFKKDDATGWNQPSSLTVEGKKIYDDLIARYNSKQLTPADSTTRNLNVLSYQQEILEHSLSYWNANVFTPKPGIDGMVAPLFLAGCLGGAAFLDYTGRLRHDLFNYLAGKNQSSPLLSIDKFFATGTSIGKIALLTAFGLIAVPSVTQSMIATAHNYLYSTKNEKIQKEIALIGNVKRILEVFYE